MSITNNILTEPNFIMELRGRPLAIISIAQHADRLVEASGALFPELADQIMKLRALIEVLRPPIRPLDHLNYLPRQPLHLGGITLDALSYKT